MFHKSHTEQPLFVDYQYTYIGGPKTFMYNLQTFLESKDYYTTKDVKKAKGIFFATKYKFDVLDYFKSINGPIIQRLDGVFYAEKHGGDLQYSDVDAKEIYNKYSTYYIFQSDYSLRQCLSSYGEVSEDKYSIIVNGAHENLFYALENSEPEIKGKVKFITTGNFRNIDMIEPVVLALDKLTKDLDFELHVYGDISNKSLIDFIDRPYLIWHGQQDLEVIAKGVRESHIFLYSHLNPPCPNSVVEAISAGIPVVGFDSGAMSELLDFSTELLAPVSDNLFQSYEEFDYKKLQEKLILAVENYSKFKKLAIENNNKYTFESCGQSYLEIFNKLIQ